MTPEAGGNSGIDGPELNWRRRRRCHRNFLVLQLGHSKFGGARILQKLPMAKEGMHSLFLTISLLGFWCWLIPCSQLSCWRHPFYQFLLSKCYCNIDTWLMDTVFDWCWGECFQRTEITDFVWMAWWGSKAGGGFQAYAGHTSVIEEGGRWRMSIHSRHKSIWVRAWKSRPPFGRRQQRLFQSALSFLHSDQDLDVAFWTLASSIEG